MSEALLAKYPHLRLLLAKQRETLKENKDESKEKILAKEVGEPSNSTPKIVVACNDTNLVDNNDNGSSSMKTTLKKRITAEELFAASVAADDDRWIQFQIEENISEKDQLKYLEKWLDDYSPSSISRSSGIGWIAVKFKDKGKKVIKAKEAWDRYRGEKNMDVINKFADDFNVKGGKWLCHLSAESIDKIWSTIAKALLSGVLGPFVYMVKVSPVNDVGSKQAQEDKEHVICVYNTDYRDTEQVMKVEYLLRFAGVDTPLTYKPDIFSALGIYRNNKWGFRAVIYISRVFSFVEGKSKVEVVGTDKWYYNSAKGLEQSASNKEQDKIREKKVFTSSRLSKRQNDGAPLKDIVQHQNQSVREKTVEYFVESKGKEDAGSKASFKERAIEDKHDEKEDKYDIKDENKSTDLKMPSVDPTPKKQFEKKPAWLIKLEQLKLNNVKCSN